MIAVCQLSLREPNTLAVTLRETLPFGSVQLGECATRDRLRLAAPHFRCAEFFTTCPIRAKTILHMRDISGRVRQGVLLLAGVNDRCVLLAQLREQVRGLSVTLSSN